MNKNLLRALFFAVIGLAFASSCDIIGIGFPSELQGTWSDSYDTQYYRFDAFKMYYHSDLYHNDEYAYSLVEFDKSNKRFKERSSSGTVNAWYYEVEGDTLKLHSCNGSDYTGTPSSWGDWYR